MCRFTDQWQRTISISTCNNFYFCLFVLWKQVEGSSWSGRVTWRWIATSSRRVKGVGSAGKVPIEVVPTTITPTIVFFFVFWYLPAWSEFNVDLTAAAERGISYSLPRSRWRFGSSGRTSSSNGIRLDGRETKTDPIGGAICSIRKVTRNENRFSQCDGHGHAKLSSLQSASSE